MTHLSEGSLIHSLHCACLYRGKKLYWVLHIPSVSKLHLMVAKFQPGWWPTCNGAVLSRGLLSPEWDKNLDVSVPPLSKPIHCQLDPPAGEYLFVSMTIKKREDDEEKLSWSLEFSLTELVMKRQNKTAFESFASFQENNLAGYPGGTNPNTSSSRAKKIYLKEFGYLKTEISYPPFLWPKPFPSICIWMDLSPKVQARP